MSWDGFLNNHVSKGVLTTCWAHSCCALHDLSVTGFFITAASATGNTHQGQCRKCVGPILESLQILLAVCTSCLGLNVYYCVLRVSYTWQTSTSKRNSWSVQHVRQVWIFEAKVSPSTRNRLPLKPKRKGTVHELQAFHVAALDLVMRGAQSEKHCSFFGKHFRFIAVSLERLKHEIFLTYSNGVWQKAEHRGCAGSATQALIVQLKPLLHDVL